MEIRVPPEPQLPRLSRLVTPSKRRSYALTARAAETILSNNTSVITSHTGTEYTRTVPSREFYFNQWNWDSAVVAMGLVHTSPERAYEEITSLIAGQWDNGMIPHVLYNPDETRYYPQADKWRTDHIHSGEIATSGITQPPILAHAVAYVYKHSPDRQKAQEFLEGVLPALIKSHRYLKTYRDPEDCGLLTIIHPWESGTDNSPRWDSVYAHMSVSDIPQRVKDDVDAHRTDTTYGKDSHRPSNEDYYRYMHLVDIFANMGWDYKKIVAESPFAVKDLLFSSIWAASNDALTNLLESMGKNSEAATYRAWATQTRNALANTWSEEHQQYCDIDVTQRRHTPIIEPTSAQFAPLFAGAVPPEQLPAVLDKLTDTNQFWTESPIASTAVDSPKFEPTRYWRGPTWPIINLLITQGLLAYGEQNSQAQHLAEKLMEKSLEMIRHNGFWEYFHPHGKMSGRRNNTGNTAGFGEFSWTAAIFRVFLAMYEESAHLKN